MVVDTVITLVLAFVLYQWSNEIILFWTRPVTPSEFCIPLADLFARREPSQEEVLVSLAFYIGTVVALLAFIKGKRRIIRAMRIADFAILVANVLSGSHTISVRPSWMPADFEIALDRFLWFVIAIGMVIVSIEMIALVMGIRKHMRAGECILLIVQGFGFLNVQMAADFVKHWSDTAILAFLGWWLAWIESLMLIPDLKDGEWVFDPSKLIVTGAITVAAWLVLGVIGWLLFLSGWAIRFC